MKTRIKSTSDALSFLLQGLYYTEVKLKEIFPTCCSSISSDHIRKEVNNYTSSADNKLLKLERIFNYLLTEPLVRKNTAVDELLAEMHQVLESTTSPHIRDILSIGYVQNINTYKISTYRSAYKFAVELDLDTVTDLLQQILEWEVDTSKVLSHLAIEEFTKAHQPVKS
jgi:ferritin-like metal-binding protein YciE